jgi:hypothetical protein
MNLEERIRLIGLFLNAARVAFSKSDRQQLRESARLLAIMSDDFIQRAKSNFEEDEKMALEWLNCKR